MKKQPIKPGDDKGPAKEPVPGNPEYPPGEDIYSRAKKEPLEEDDIPVKGKKNEPSQDDELDVPGAELDDADEELGEEDEENNYYSLGGDNHADLDEN